MTQAPQKTQSIQQSENPDVLLAAARLLLGDDLATRLIEDQWNLVNELSDPYDIKGHSARYSMHSARLAAEVVHKLTSAMQGPMMDLSDRKLAAISALSEEAREEWFKGNAPKPESYAKERAAPFAGNPMGVLSAAIIKAGVRSEFPAAKEGVPTLPVTCMRRNNGSALIHVGNPYKGAHYACDYFGDLETGPRHASDFAEEPPAWVLEALGIED